MSEHIYLCLSDLLDQDTTSYEYFQTLPKGMQSLLREQEICSFQELQDHADMIRTSGLL